MKKRIAVILSISILVIGVVGIYIFLKQKAQVMVSAPGSVPTNPPIELALWEDQAGFSFKYPKELAFNKHDEDQVNYAHIEFTSTLHPGKLIVWAKDTIYADVNSWATKDKALAGAPIVDTTLGGVPAKKIIIATPIKKLITGAISEQILFTIEGEPVEGDSFWTSVSDTVVSSFVFTPIPTDTETNASFEDAGPSVDEEEVLE